MQRSSRYVLATVLATLSIAVPSIGQARPKIPGNMTRGCLLPSGTTLENGETRIVVDDETCSTAESWCNDGTVCTVIKWDAVCGDQDFGAPKTVSECYQSPAPSKMVTTLDPSTTWTPTTPTTSTVPNATLRTWY